MSVLKLQPSQHSISYPIIMIGSSLLLIIGFVLWFSVHAYNQYVTVHNHAMFTLQTTAITLALGVAVTFGYIIYTRVIKPLKQLEKHTRNAIAGEKSIIIEHQFDDEIGHLGLAFNQLTHTINQLQQKLDSSNKPQHQVSELELNKDIAKEIKDLQNDNKALKLELMCINIFNQWDLSNNKLPAEDQLQLFLIKLADLSKINNIDLCLTQPQNETPYLHIRASGRIDKRVDCANTNCAKCVGDIPFSAKLPGETLEKFPLVYRGQNYGVMVLNMEKSATLKLWQQKIIEKIVEQLSCRLALHHNYRQPNTITIH